jgi:sporulation protein YlmC with PRC-barrel domain
MIAMETRRQFQQDAGVFSVNGHRLGQLERVVLDPESKVITHLVISKGALLDKEERVVPIDMLIEATESQITLKPQAGDLETFPIFETPHYVPKDEEPAQQPGAAIATNAAFGTPMVVSPIEPMPASSDEVIATRIDRNIPEGTVAMKEGAKVITAEGKETGHIERILVDAGAEKVTHLLVSRGLFSKEKKLIPIKWVTLVGEEEVHLRVEEAALDELADSAVQ